MVIEMSKIYKPAKLKSNRINDFMSYKMLDLIRIDQIMHHYQTYPNL